MTALEQHIRAENAKRSAWVAEDPDNRCAFLTVEDASHWAKYGVHTVEQYELFQARAELWDVYKDVHGIRPRWMGIDEMSLAQVQAELESLYAEARAVREAEERAVREAEEADREHARRVEGALTSHPLTQKLFA